MENECEQVVSKLKYPPLVIPLGIIWILYMALIYGLILFWSQVLRIVTKPIRIGLKRVYQEARDRYG